MFYILLELYFVKPVISFFFFYLKACIWFVFFFFSTLRGRPAALVVADCSQAHEWTVEDLSLCFFSCFIFIFSFFSGRNVYSRYPCTPFLRYICIYMYVVRFVCSYALKAFLFPLMVLTRTLPLAVLKRLFYLFFLLLSASEELLVCFVRVSCFLSLYIPEPFFFVYFLPVVSFCDNRSGLILALTCFSPLFFFKL